MFTFSICVIKLFAFQVLSWFRFEALARGLVSSPPWATESTLQAPLLAGSHNSDYCTSLLVAPGSTIRLPLIDNLYSDNLYVMETEKLFKLAKLPGALAILTNTTSPAVHQLMPTVPAQYYPDCVAPNDTFLSSGAVITKFCLHFIYWSVSVLCLTIKRICKSYKTVSSLFYLNIVHFPILSAKKWTARHRFLWNLRGRGVSFPI